MTNINVAYSKSSTHNDYLEYDLTDEQFTMPHTSEKTSLPSAIRQSLLNWCTDSDSSKNAEKFWDAIPVEIISTTSEFQSLRGMTNSFVAHSYTADESCPPYVELAGIFTSENGDMHKFALSYDDNFFKYHIDDASSLQYQMPGRETSKSLHSPLKQIRLGTPVSEIQCKVELELALKSSDSSPICVKPETKIKLIERGWAKPI